MLLNLLDPPKTREEWEAFSFAHRDSHLRIIQAIKEKYGTTLSEYILHPFPEPDVDGWKMRNSQAHSDMNNVLGLQGSDLRDVDFDNEQEKIEWWNNHYQEHYDAESKLGV